MDRIFCRKLMLGMMLLGIPTLFEVQAIDHALATFHLSSVDGPNYENIHQLIFCIWNAHTHCEPIALKRDEEGYGTCMIEGYQHCMNNPKYQDDPDYKAARQCQVDCSKEAEKSSFRLGSCLLTCFLHHSNHNKTWYVVSTDMNAHMHEQYIYLLATNASKIQVA